MSNQIVAESIQVPVRSWLRYTRQSGIARSEQRGNAMAKSLEFLDRVRQTLGVSADEILDQARTLSSPSQPGEAPGCDSPGENLDLPGSPGT